MDFLTNNSFRMMEKSMDFLWAKQAAILDNIANAETPNYKAKVVRFEDSLKEKPGICHTESIGAGGSGGRAVCGHGAAGVYPHGRQRRQRHGAERGDDPERLSAAVCDERHQQRSEHPAHGGSRSVKRHDARRVLRKISENSRLRQMLPADCLGGTIWLF